MSNEFSPDSDPLHPALDRALGRALRPPPLPVGFRARLDAALEQAKRPDELVRLRERLEREQRARLAEIEAGYVRLRQRALGALIGSAFAAGAAVAFLMPRFEAWFGPRATLAIAIAGAAVGISIGAISWVGRLGLARLVPRA